MEKLSELDESRSLDRNCRGKLPRLPGYGLRESRFTQMDFKIELIIVEACVNLVVMKLRKQAFWK